MLSIFQDDMDSFTSSESSETTKEDDMYFLTKITEELKSHFSRNCGKEDYCEDIYEDLYSTPVSGSYSYYADLIAQSKEKEQLGTTHSRNQSSPSFPTYSDFHCTSTCTGYRNSRLGIGPLENLFQVLEEKCLEQSSKSAFSDFSCRSQIPNTSSFPSSESQYMNIVEHVDYSDFIEVFHHWSCDAQESFTSPDLHDFGTFEAD